MGPLASGSREYDEASGKKNHRILRPEVKEYAMTIKLYRDSDALYFRLDENRIVESEEDRLGVILDVEPTAV